MLGKGSFGEVFDATIKETGQRVAVKRVLQDKRFKVSGTCTCQHANGKCWRYLLPLRVIWRRTESWRS